tara:strand:+ start:59 stop:523 length:465 start_codon:yes stop_codon:yes gene_type:complete
MKKTDEYILSRLKWKAEQYSLPTKYSFYFENIEDEKKAYFSESLNDQNIGIPTWIFTNPNNNKWTIIGTRKIMWSENGQSESLLFSNIKEIRPHSFDSMEKVNDAINDSLPKTEWNELTLTEKNNKKRTVYANNGSDFFAMWNIIRMVWQLNLN